MPVVTTTVLALGAREMANEKALVNRYGCIDAEAQILNAFSSTTIKAARWLWL